MVDAPKLADAENGFKKPSLSLVNLPKSGNTAIDFSSLRALPCRTTTITMLLYSSRPRAMSTCRRRVDGFLRHCPYGMVGPHASLLPDRGLVGMPRPFGGLAML